MKVFNLTDKMHPDGRTFWPRTILVNGKRIAPGKFAEFTSAFNPSSIAGMCRRGVAAMGNSPGWYNHAKVPVKAPQNVNPKKEEAVGLESVVSVNAVDVDPDYKPRKKKNKK